ncbi:MAG: flagellin FliC [Betaproteobacteria bacterium]|nr:flagellin FliC [Betaproteobacteria bacterium]
MASTINTNVASLTAQRNLAISGNGLQTAISRLSSGLRINSAADDAAGLGISDRMNAQVKGLNVAARNAADAISAVQTYDSALGGITDMLQRMREIAVQANNATNSTDDLDNLQAEYSQLGTEIDRVITATKFNGNADLDGGATLTYQVGANTGDTIDVTVADMSGLTAQGEDVSADAEAAMDAIDADIITIATERANYSAVQNVFTNVISTVQAAATNQAAARGRIVDADFAQETAALTRAQILQQAGTAMVAQANQLPNSVLSLLK